MPSNEPRGPRQIYKALLWSINGLRLSWRFEASFRLEVYLFVIFFPLGLWLGHGAIEKSLLCGSLFLVLSAEVMNSAVEAVVDKASPEFHELAGRAKDMGSAAVFLLMLNFMLTWGLILGQRWLQTTSVRPEPVGGSVNHGSKIVLRQAQHERDFRRSCFEFDRTGNLQMLRRPVIEVGYARRPRFAQG